MADNRVKITIETDAGRSEQVLNGVKDSLQKVENQYKETGKESQTFAATTDKAINSVATSLKNLVAAFSSVKVAKDAFFLAQDAAKYNEIALYAKNAAEAVGISFDKMMEASRQGTNGIISNMKIMQSNMKALKLGLQADAEQMGKLWEIARHASKETGEQIEHTFDKITKAINTGNARSLISMGVLSENFKRANGEMGLLGKRGELLKTVLEQLGERTNELGNIGETSYDKYKKLDVAFQGLKNTIGQALLPAFESMVEWLTKIITKGDEALKVLQNPVFWGQKDNLDVNEYRTTNQLKKELEKNEQIITKLRGMTQEQVNALSDEEIEKLRDNYREAVTNAKAINDELKKREDLEKKRIENQVKLFLKSEEFNKELEKSKNITEIMLRLGGGLAGSFDKAAANAKKLEQQEQAMAAKARKAQEDLIQKSLDEIQAFHENSLAATEFGATLENLSSKSLVDMQKSLADGKTSLSEFGAEITAVFSDFVSGDMITGLANIGQKLDPLEQTLREIDEDFKSWSQKIDDLQEIENILNGISKVDFSDLEKGLSNADTRMQTATNFMLTQAMGAASQATGVLDITKSTKPEETIKKGWAAIKNQVKESLADAVTSGIINSNLGEALRGAITSIAATKAQSYGSTLISGLFGNKGVNVAGALSGFVGSIAIGAIANNWKKWFGDKNKDKTMASNASTKERGSKAYLQTYAAMLNPYMTDEMLDDLYSTRWASSGMVVSWKSKRRGGLAGLAGGKNYSDTTPQYTYDLISAMENAVKAVEKYNDKKEKELDLLNSQGYSYQVLTEQLDALSNTMDRIKYMGDEYTHSWTSGEKFSIDLSDSIQDLKKAYYEALREYGEETGARNQQKASTFLSLYPFLDDFKRSYSSSTFDFSDSPSYFYNEIANTQTNLLNRYADPRMLEMIKEAGKEQYNLASMQYTTEDTSKYTEAYLKVLERQKEAAELVMQQQEQIYRDMTKTFEEQSAALETYQQAQEQYYNTKLEILAQERAKEEQLKKEEQQAKLRTADRMEALLGFTGEMAKRGDNNIYILEGADQIGALREMEKYIDDPEALAFVQRLITAALNKNKYGKIG